MNNFEQIAYSKARYLSLGLETREEYWAGLLSAGSAFLNLKMADQVCWKPGHWRQTQSLLRSNRAGVRWLSQDLCPRREEIPAQSKVGGLAAKTSLDQLFVQYKCTVMDEINGHYLQLP